MVQPLVSICIPVFNGEKYLNECIESSLSQAYQNIEIIIVDDGSSDKSIDIIKEYSLKDNRVKYYINEENLGLVANWNKCIRQAAGEWIKFLFQDDYFESNCITMFVEYVERTGGKIPLLASKRRFLINRTLSKKENLYYAQNLPSLDKIKVKLQKSTFIPKALCNAAVKHMAMNFIGEPTNVMFKKEITDALGYFNESLEQICDLEYVMRIASNYGIVYIPHELTWFRIHDQSTTIRNIEGKYYRLSCLEPVKLAHLLLFDKLYMSFRKQLTLPSIIKLKLYFYVRGYEAYFKAKYNSIYMNSFDSAVEKFPKMLLLKKESLSRKMLYWLIIVKRYFAA